MGKTKNKEYQIHSLDLRTVKQALNEAKADLKKVIKENKQHYGDPESDALEMAEEAAQLNVRQLEEKVYLLKHGMPVYTVVDFYSRRD
jgi:RNA polymerase-binding transcription factor DksA